MTVISRSRPLSTSPTCRATQARSLSSGSAMSLTACTTFASKTSMPELIIWNRMVSLLSKWWYSAALEKFNALAMSCIEVASYPRSWNSRAAVRRISRRLSPGGFLLGLIGVHPNMRGLTPNMGCGGDVKHRVTDRLEDGDLRRVRPARGTAGQDRSEFAGAGCGTPLKLVGPNGKRIEGRHGFDYQQGVVQRGLVQFVAANADRVDVRARPQPGAPHHRQGGVGARADHFGIADGGLKAGRGHGVPGFCAFQHPCWRSPSHYNPLKSKPCSQCPPMRRSLHAGAEYSQNLGIVPGQASSRDCGNGRSSCCRNRGSVEQCQRLAGGFVEQGDQSLVAREAAGGILRKDGNQFGSQNARRATGHGGQ